MEKGTIGLTRWFSITVSSSGVDFDPTRDLAMSADILVVTTRGMILASSGSTA